MRTLLVSIVTTLGLIVAGAVHATEAPASAPAGTTGQCKDGSWYSGASKKGACHGHQGVKEWYGAAETSSAAAPAKSSSKSTSSTSTTSTTAATTASTGTPPAGATGLCNDGTYYSGENKKGACHGHKGVKTWYGATAATGAAPAAMPAPKAMPAASPVATPAKPAMAPAATPATHSTAATGMPAAGGGAGKVWVNTSSKVYHCQGDRYYGNTKEGEYMSEADALAKGNRAAQGKSCSK